MNLNELELALDHSNRANIESSKSIKRLNFVVDELQKQVEEEHRQRNEAIAETHAIEHRLTLLHEEMSEISGRLEMSDKARKSTENELHQAANKIAELSAVASNLASTKRKLEAELATLNGDLDEALAEMKVCEERERKAADDAARLVEELRMEQEHSETSEKARRQLEAQIKDLQGRLNEAETNLMKVCPLLYALM